MVLEVKAGLTRCDGHSILCRTRMDRLIHGYIKIMHDLLYIN